MREEWGAVYGECFGTKKQQRKFYKEEFPKRLVTWGKRFEKNGRIAFSITVPANSIMARSVRGSFLEAAKKIPRVHRGGVGHIVKPDEVPKRFADVKARMQEGHSLPSAIREVARSWGIDPRTLKTTLKRSGDLARLQKSLPRLAQRKARQMPSAPSRDAHGEPGRCYTRNIGGGFDVVSRK